MTNEEYHKHDQTNLLIAEFMGMETVDRHPRTGEWTEAHFDYHVGWGIMDVVERIESRIMNNSVFMVEIHGASCVIDSFGGYRTARIEKHSDNKRTAIYEAVVKFIKWYNENRQQ